jgi:thiamine-phosphate pyrophosphorylase
MLRFAITGGTACGLVNTAQIEQLETQVRRWAAAGIDFIQLREKSLDPGALLLLAEAARRTLDATHSATKLLINARADLAIAARADGVHLTAYPDELTPQQVRALYQHAGLAWPIVSVSCHTMDEINRARDNSPDLILFGPVFEKRVAGELISPGVGLDSLHSACQAADPVPVLALGGVTAQAIPLCLQAGAAGVAGIRLFG